MRLTQIQVAHLKRIVAASDPKAKLILFGSRVDDSARGGDIDLLVESETIDAASRRRLKIQLYDAIGAQKIDLVVVTPGSDASIARVARSTGVPL